MKIFKHSEDNLKELYTEHSNANHLDSVTNILFHTFIHPSISRSIHFSVCVYVHFKVNCIHQYSSFSINIIT